MSLLDNATPEQHRARYEALKKQAEARAAHAASAPPSRTSPLSDDAVIHREAIPDGWYWITRITRGQSLRITNPSGRAAVSMLLWNSNDTAERLNVADTLKVQWNAAFGVGAVLFSDMGRVLVSIVGDTSGGHDGLVGGSTKQTNEGRYGVVALRNTRDNFLLAAAKLGLGRRDIMPCVTFFAPVRTTAEGRFSWQGNLVKPGDSVELRAEMNLLAVLSNCPHPLDPHTDYAPGAVDAVIWQAPPPAPDDPCRAGSEEARRGFENTDPLFRF